MASFVKQGLTLEVFSFDSELKLPAGIRLRQAAEITDQSLSQAYRDWDKSSYITTFSDLFRYRLLQAEGGIWMDTDMLCLKSTADYAELFSSGQPTVSFQESGYINGAMLMSPAGHPIMADLIQLTMNYGFKLAEWGAIGPTLLTDYSKAHPQAFKVLPVQAFHPLHFVEFILALLPESYAQCQERCQNSYGLHLWNRFYQQFCIPKNVFPPEGSFLYEQFRNLLPDDLPALPAETVRMLVKGGYALNKLDNYKKELTETITRAIADY